MGNLVGSSISGNCCINVENFLTYPLALVSLVLSCLNESL